MSSSSSSLVPEQRSVAAANGGVTLLERDFTFPGAPVETTCRVLVRARRSGGTPVALIEDSSSNEGLSVHLRFDEITRTIRARLPADLAEPVWVERWVERAVASWLLADGEVTSDHLMMRTESGWWRRPLSSSVTRQLLAG